MRALVLAAGFGTRLRPWTLEVPKPLVPVAGIEPLYFTFAQLEAMGVVDVTINTHHLPEKISEFCGLLKSHFRSIAVSLSFEKGNILGSGGGVLKVLKDKGRFKDGLLIINGDILAKYDYSGLKAERSTFSTSFAAEFTEKYEGVLVNEKDEWCGLDPAKIPGTRRGHFFGVHYLSPQDCLWLAENTPTTNASLFELIYQALGDLNRAPLAREILLEGEKFWYDLNSAELYDYAEKELRSKWGSYWNSLLKRRHPGVDSTKAWDFWPLNSPK